MIRLDMTNPFLRLVTKLSLRTACRADYAKSIMEGRFPRRTDVQFHPKRLPREREPARRAEPRRLRDTFADLGSCAVMNRPSQRQCRTGCRPKLRGSDTEKVGLRLDFA
jgi:hypothetical protein